MSVRRLEGRRIALVGACGLDDAEPLLHALSASPDASVDWRACESVHAAILQILMAAGAPLVGPPKAGLLRDIVEPALTRYRERGFHENL